MTIRGLRYRWEFLEPKISTEDFEGSGVSQALARILSVKGITPEAVDSFLNPQPDTLQEVPPLPNLDEAITRITRAIERGETIMVHGDYDVDGITSMALLVRNLERLGTKRVVPYVPSRFVEGYGLSEQAIKYASDVGASLIITVDCGVTALKEISLARELGIDVVVTDHHEPPKVLPDAVAVVDPKCHPEAPHELAGVGVAFELMNALYQRHKSPLKPLLWDLDLVALGTVADQVPLRGINRTLVRLGLKALTNSLKVGMKALMKVSGKSGEVTCWDVLYLLAPRINAAGRISHAKNALRLLLTRDGEEALTLARALDTENKKRQDIEERIHEEARALALKEEEKIILVLAKDGWHEGVIGIVASRIVEEFNKPTILIALEGDEGKGSGRSIPPFNLFKALEVTEEYLMAYGGHRMAAGLRIKRNKIDAFREAINEYGGSVLTPEDLEPVIKVDAKISLGEVNDGLLKEIELLSPFGAGNPTPVFYIEDVEVVGNPRRVGEDHLRFSLRDETGHAPAIFFGGGEFLERLERGKTRIDAVFKIREDEWAKRPLAELHILDFRFRE
jgi:single-stranded-DNA-specific exonuclease